MWTHGKVLLEATRSAHFCGDCLESARESVEKDRRRFEDTFTDASEIHLFVRRNPIDRVETGRESGDGMGRRIFPRSGGRMRIRPES